MNEPSKLKQWVFVLSFVGFILLFLVSGVGMGIELWTGNEISWWWPTGLIGTMLWLVSMYLRPEIAAWVIEDKDNGSE